MCLLTSSCWAASIGTSEEVEGGEEEDPDQVDEVPVEPGVLDAVGEVLGILRPELGAGPEQVAVDDDPADDVQAVQAGHGEVDGVEVVVRGGVTEVELVRVLEVLHHQEHERQRDGGAHPEPEAGQAPHLAARQASTMVIDEVISTAVLSVASGTLR